MSDITRRPLLAFLVTAQHEVNGSLFTQTRSMSRGRNWPSSAQGAPAGPPRPAVIAIAPRRKR